MPIDQNAVTTRNPPSPKIESGTRIAFTARYGASFLRNFFTGAAFQRSSSSAVGTFPARNPPDRMTPVGGAAGAASGYAPPSLPGAGDCTVRSVGMMPLLNATTTD